MFSAGRVVMERGCCGARNVMDREFRYAALLVPVYQLSDETLTLFGVYAMNRVQWKLLCGCVVAVTALHGCAAWLA
jgi:hypothetical protein